MTHLIAGIFDIVIGCAMLLLFLRFMFQFAGLDAKQEPAVKLVYRLTRIVDVFGRIFPTIGNGRINTSAVMLMLLVRLIFIWGVLTLMKINHDNIGLFHLTEVNSYALQILFQQITAVRMFFVASMTLINDFLRISELLIMVSFAMSFMVMMFQKIPPILGLASRLSDSLIEPFRKILPSMGMLDITPMIAYGIIIITSAIINTMTVYLLTL